MRLIPLLGLTLLFSGCAVTPKPLSGEYAALSPMSVAKSGASDGERVRWGGKIIQVEPQTDMTCFEILSRDLSASGRPKYADQTTGRFIACRPGFYDPAVFTKNREVTVTGQLMGVQLRKVGDYDYRFPTVNADVIYLWPERFQESVQIYPAWSLGWGHRGGWGFGWDIPIIMRRSFSTTRHPAQTTEPEPDPAPSRAAVETDSKVLHQHKEDEAKDGHEDHHEH